MRKTAIIMALLMTLSGCSAFAPEPRPEAPLPIPANYTMYNEGELAPDQWWTGFDSTELNALVEKALAANFDVRTAWAKLRQADAAARKAGASLLPSLDLEGKAQQKRLGTKASGSDDTKLTEEQSWNLGLAASYEVDLWGRLSSADKAAQLSVEAAREDLYTAAVTVAATVAETWIDILAARRKLRILEQQIEINTTLLRLQMLRFANGKAGALDVSQQRQALAAARAELPLLQLRERQLMGAMAILLGQATTADLSITQTDLPGAIPLPRAGLPADLLAARPDVRAAGLRLNSADWSVSAARADRLPSLVLSAGAAFSAGALDILFQNWVATLAASLTGPIFDGGKRQAEVDRARAEADQYLAQYARTVAKAIVEVEDTMAAQNRQREYLGLLQEQLAAAHITMRDARTQYLHGQSDYLSYLAAWTSVQNLELSQVTQQAALLKYQVGLYRVLGGDWTRRILPKTQTGEQTPTTTAQSKR